MPGLDLLKKATAATISENTGKEVSVEALAKKAEGAERAAKDKGVNLKNKYQDKGKDNLK